MWGPIHWAGKFRCAMGVGYWFKMTPFWDRGAVGYPQVRTMKEREGNMWLGVLVVGVSPWVHNGLSHTMKLNISLKINKSIRHIFIFFSPILNKTAFLLLTS